MSNLFVLLGVLFLLSFVPLVFLFARGYLRYRGERLVTCPQDGQFAKVRLDAAKAALSSMSDSPDLHVASCDRWPGQKDCKQGCVEASAPAPLTVPHPAGH